MPHFVSYTLTSAPASVIKEVRKALKAPAPTSPNVAFAKAAYHDIPSAVWAEAAAVIATVQDFHTVGIIASWMTREMNSNETQRYLDYLDDTLLKIQRVSSGTRQLLRLDEVRKLIKIRSNRFECVVVFIPPLPQS